MGLVPALESYIEDFVNGNEELEVGFQSTGIKKRPDPEIEIILYRILQEALNNISKHAHAKHVNVLLAYSYPNLIFTIKDDGVGFRQRESTSPFETKDNAIGLIGMRERVASVGGTIHVHSSEGNGTAIRVELPITI